MAVTTFEPSLSMNPAWKHWPQQSVTTTSTANSSSMGPPLTLTSDDYERIAKAKEFVRVQDEPWYQPFVPDSQKSKAWIAAELAGIATFEGRRTCERPFALSRLLRWPPQVRDWYVRVDKVEFWASVVVVAWYVAHVLGVV